MSNTPHKNHNGHGSLKSYIIGFILSIVLTIVPYIMVVHHSFAVETILISIVAIAIVQLLIQLIFFLHLDTKNGESNNSLAFIFTVIIIVILVTGSLWIMYNMNYNMMDH